jgi:hypothetical protein
MPNGCITNLLCSSKIKPGKPNLSSKADDID